MTSCTFTIALPVRNGADHISLAIESVLAQSFSDFELVILENCSEDNTLSIIQDFNDPRIRVFPSASPLNIEENWGRINTLELAEFLTVLSHDDVLYPDFLETINCLIRNNPGTSLYQTQFHLIDSDGNVLRECRPIPSYENAEEFLHSRHQYRRDSFGTGYVMRSVDFTNAGGFPLFPKLVFADDVLWYKLAALGGKACDQGFYFAYRTLAGSQAKRINIHDLYVCTKGYTHFLENVGFLDKPDHARHAINYVRRAYYGQYRRTLLGLIKTGDPQQINAYHKDKEKVFQEDDTGSFTKRIDLISRLLELIVHQGMPKYLRNSLARMIILFGDISGRIRGRPPDDV